MAAAALFPGFLVFEDVFLESLLGAAAFDEVLAVLVLAVDDCEDFAGAAFLDTFRGFTRAVAFFFAIDFAGFFRDSFALAAFLTDVAGFGGAADFTFLTTLSGPRGPFG